jgi:hypothetical protein
MDEWERQQDLGWNRVRAYEDAAEFGIPVSALNRIEARYPDWGPFKVAMWALHEVAARLSVGTADRRRVMGCLASLARNAGESAQDYQREFHKEECLDLSSVSSVVGVVVAGGHRCDDDPECQRRIGVLSSIEDACCTPPLPCDKAWCYCYLQPVFDHEIT